MHHLPEHVRQAGDGAPRQRASWLPRPPLSSQPSAPQAPCQHNFCLDCFNDWVKRHNSTCPTCRAPLPKSMCSNPRINAALVSAIRLVCTARLPVHAFEQCLY